MKLHIKYIVIFSLMLSCLMSIQAQNAMTFSGKITNNNGEALAGVTILGDEGNVVAISDLEGNFSITVEKNNILLFELDSYNSLRMDGNALSSSKEVVLTQPKYGLGEAGTINIPFRKMEKRRITGSVNEVDISEELKFDRREGIYTSINGKVPGVFGNADIYGINGAVLIVDGVVRDAANYNLTEIDKITVVKSGVAKALYGAQADGGVILATTKRGQAYKKKLTFMGEYGYSTPKVLPDFLDAASYMEKYNEAYLNDNPGTAADALPYSQEAINATRNGSNPTRYPDEDYYTDKYIKNGVSYFDLTGEASGGNENATYYMNVGWRHNQGWLNHGEVDDSEVINVRGNVDYYLTDNLKMNLDVVALFHFNTMSDVVTTNNQGYITENYWYKMATVRPNAYPITWSPSIITDPDVRAEIEEQAILHDGMLLGGNTEFNQGNNNSLYADLTQGPLRKEQGRTLQLNTGFDWDLGFLTEGLKATAFLTFDFYNSLITNQNGEYAQYQPLFLTDQSGADSIGVTTFGVDQKATNYEVQANQSYFQRRVGLYGTLQYDKTIGEHSISAIALGYRDQLTLPFDLDASNHATTHQDFKNLHFAVALNYMLSDKYVAELAGVMIGSQKLPKGERYGVAPVVGAGWILSEEDFLSGSSFIDYLKLRTSYGIYKNDNWDNYFLHETAYNRSGNWRYDRGSRQTQGVQFSNRANNIELQKRKEFSIGFDALLLDRSTSLEIGYFNSRSADLITEMENTYPLHMGTTDVTFYENYNGFSDAGMELGLSYKKAMGDLQLTLGSNMVYSVPKVLKMEEPFYADDAQYRYQEGEVSDAIWGYVDDGLYSASDFESDGSLVSGLPTVSWASSGLQPGDIKYKDLNEDGVIDEDDQEIIGNNSARFQYSLYIKLKYKNIEFYALGTGQTGQDRRLNGNYYWVYGSNKFSSVVNDAYSPSNQDPNAAYPRLSVSNNTNNFRNSSFWIYKNNWFKIPTMQLTYHFNTNGKIFRNASAYVRGYDLVSINKNKDKSELNIYSSPQTQGFAVGFITNF